MSDPKPCPFCGSSDVGGAGGQVHCYSCPAVIEVQNTNTPYAVDLWNRRTDNAELSRLQSENEALRAQLTETEEKGRVLMGMCRDLKARVTELLTVCQAVQRDLLLRAEPDWDGSGQKVVNLSAGFWEELNRVIGKYDDTACKSFDAIILRKQAEAVESLIDSHSIKSMSGDFIWTEAAEAEAQRLRTQADELERQSEGGGKHG